MVEVLPSSIERFTLIQTSRDEDAGLLLKDLADEKDGKLPALTTIKLETQYGMEEGLEEELKDRGININC